MFCLIPLDEPLWFQHLSSNIGSLFNVFFERGERKKKKKEKQNNGLKYNQNNTRDSAVFKRILICQGTV